MENPEVSRRTLLKTSVTTIGGLTALRIAGPMQAFGQPGDEVIPWRDQPPPDPFPTDGNLLKWETLESWLIPTDDFFFVSHYGPPENLEESLWLECSGNTGTDNFIVGIGNARWGGTPLALLLEEAGVLASGTEVIFWGADSSKVTIRDNVGILSGGKTGTVEPDAEGGLDLTITEQFARSMSLSEALSRDNLLCYEMNGQTLPALHGFPLARARWPGRLDV